MLQRRVAWLLFAAVLMAPVLTAMLPSPALAQRNRRSSAQSKYKIGQKVMVNWDGAWVPGIVINVDEFGHFGHVRVKTRKFTHGWPFEPEDIRPLPSAASRAGSNSSDSVDPFSTDEEKFDKVGRRTWTDTTGKFKVEAKIARLEAGAVVLKRADGKEITVPFAKLAPADRAIVEKLRGPTKSADEDDWDSDGDAMGDDLEEEDEFLNPRRKAPEVKTLEVNATKAKPLDLGIGVKWTYAPRPAPTSTASPVRVSLGGKRDFHDEVSQILFMPDMSRAFVIYRQAHDHEMPPRAIACDLTEGVVGQQGDFYSGQLPLAVNSNGKTLVARSDGFGFGKAGTLYVHRLEGYEAKPQYAWNPYAMHSDRGSSQDVADALFVDEERLLTVNADGVMYIWSVGETVQPLFFGQLARGSGLALDANRDCLAVRSESGVALIDPKTGKSLGHLSAPEKSWHSQLAIRSDGRRLALGEGGRIRVWDLRTQELIRDFSVSNYSGQGSIAWADDQRLITKGNVIDVEKRVLLWKYTDMQGLALNAGGLTWTVSGGHSAGDPQLLIGAALPHAEAKAIAEGLDADEVLVIKPGMEVGIQLQFAGSVADQESVRRALAQRLEEVGLKPTGQSAVMLTASITPGESETIQYHAFGSQQVTQHAVNKKVLELALSVNGKKVWKVANQTWAPHVIHMKQGESIDQAIAREMNIDPKRFESMFVPGYVAKPKDDMGAAYGTSKLPGAL